MLLSWTVWGLCHQRILDFALEILDLAVKHVNVPNSKSLKSKAFLVSNILDKGYTTCSTVLVRKFHAFTGKPLQGSAQREVEFCTLERDSPNINSS